MKSRIKLEGDFHGGLHLTSFADRVRGEFCERRISRNNIELLNGTIFADKKVKDEDALVIEQPA